MRACETPEQRDASVEQGRLRMSASRAIETPEVRRDCLEEDRHRRAASRANETTERMEARVQEVQGRVSGMSCSNGKVKLTPLQSSPDPLITPLIIVIKLNALTVRLLAHTPIRVDRF
ncbi:hypothetical protein AVEN_31653-1, partial [Araneus ventricosus]